jgi:AraC family transcriptional regulator, positive regulator of tynA and feaB
MEAILPTVECFNSPELDYEQWREVMRPSWGVYTPDNPKTFVGRIRSRTIFGFSASDIKANNLICRRTERDIRVDGVDHCYVVFQTAGRSAVIQNDHVAKLAVGDVAFCESTRPLTFLSEGKEQWLSLQLPRQPLIAHLGFEPQGGVRGHQRECAGRLLSQFVLGALDDEEDMSASAEDYMQRAVYDLIGALFASPNTAPAFSHTDRLFKRVNHVVRRHFADPDFGPSEVAAEVGISLRYLQTLFTARGSTCSRFIVSMRLDYAMRLIQRRVSTKTGQSLSEIAYTCGFREYTSFARAFRRRFGRGPGAPAVSDKMSLEEKSSECFAGRIRNVVTH